MTVPAMQRRRVVLPGPVRAPDRDLLSGCGLEVEVGQHDVLAKAVVQSFDLEDGLRSGHREMLMRILAQERDEREWCLRPPSIALSTDPALRGILSGNEGTIGAGGNGGAVHSKAAEIVMRRDPLANPERLIRSVYAYVAYRVGPGPDAEDITSETFERALRYRDSYDPSRGEPLPG